MISSLLKKTRVGFRLTFGVVFVFAQEELETGDHELGHVTEAGRGDHVDCLAVVPDVLPVELDHHVQGGLGRRCVRVLQHPEHEVLQRCVETDVLAPLVDALDVVDDVVLEKFSQRLVLALEQVEEQGQQIGRAQQAPVSKQDQRPAEGHAQVRV